MQMHQNMFLNVLKLKKYVIKLLILVLLYFILFLIDLKLTKCVAKAFSEDPFMLKHYLDSVIKLLITFY